MSDASLTAVVTVEAVVTRADGTVERIPASVTPVTDPSLVARIRAALTHQSQEG